MTYNAVDLARRLIKLSIENEIWLTNMKLQKLLYFAWKDYYREHRRYLFEDEIEEMKQILKSEAIEFDELHGVIQRVLVDAFITTATEERIAEWEKWLKLPPTGTLEERRMAVLRYFSVISKLNDQAIKTLVAQLYNGARAFSQFEDSEIKITVVPLPERFMDELDFSLLLDQLYYRKPCHIGASVERAYSTWQDINDNHETWGTVKSKFKNWEEVLMYIPR